MNTDASEWATRFLRTRSNPNRPLFAGKTNAAEREALRAEAPPPSPPPFYVGTFGLGWAGPPPPTFNVNRLPSFALPASITVEAETLAPAARADRGAIHVQQMAPFGTDWGSGAQLFWMADDGAGLLAPVNVGGAATWDVVAYFTTAPDYGVVQVFMTDANHGARPHPLAATVARLRFDAYTAGVEGPIGMPLGRITLTGTTMGLALKVDGRNPQSSGYLVGLDRIEFTRVE